MLTLFGAEAENQNQNCWESTAGHLQGGAERSSVFYWFDLSAGQQKSLATYSSNTPAGGAERLDFTDVHRLQEPPRDHQNPPEPSQETPLFSSVCL